MKEGDTRAIDVLERSLSLQCGLPCSQVDCKLKLEHCPNIACPLFQPLDLHVFNAEPFFLPPESPARRGNKDLRCGSQTGSDADREVASRFHLPNGMMPNGICHVHFGHEHGQMSVCACFPR